MKKRNLYDEGHLVVAAIRILEHQKGSPPTMEQVASMIGLSGEQTSLIIRRLLDADIIEPVEGAFGQRWGIRDHLKLEDLPRTKESNELDDALKKFQSERQKMSQKIESFKEEQARKKKDLFADIEKRLKKDLGKE